MFVINILLNSVDVFINLIRDENNEDSYYWIMLLFVFECGNNVCCMLNVGSQVMIIVVSYIVLSKSEGFVDIVEWLSELIV